MLTFYGTWSAFGSFEKGRLFGLPDVVATVNLLSPRNFERSNDHFNVNLRPFVVRKNQSMPDKELFGKNTRTATYYLADHPLRIWAENILDELPSSSIGNMKNDNTVTTLSAEQPMPDDSRVWLRQRLNLRERARLTEATISKALAKFSPDIWDDILNEMKVHYPRKALTSRLRTIIVSKKDNI